MTKRPTDTAKNRERPAASSAVAISELLKSQWQTLTKTDRKVGRALLAEYPLAGLETLAELAERGNVSVPSVVRCIKKLGFDGYPEFQRTLHREVQSLVGSAAGAAGESGAGSREGLNNIQANVRVFQNSIASSFDNVQLAELGEAARMMSDPRRRILCMGGMVSQVLARYFQAHINRIRPNTELVGNNPLDRSERLLDISRKDIIVIFDFPNYDTDNISFARLASEKNTAIVLFTDQGLSPIADIADSVICASVKSVSMFNSMVPAMSVIEVLLSELVSTIGKKARERIQSFDDVPGGVAVNWDEESDDDRGNHHRLTGRLT